MTPGVERLSRKLLGAVCIAVLCVILSLGLWPFHIPKNDVTWLGNRAGLRFGRFSTAISSGALQMTGSPNETGSSLEIWSQPGRIWDSGTLLAFYTPENMFQFSLRQSQRDFELQTGKTRLYVDDAFPRTGPMFATVTSGPQGTLVYIDGVLTRTAPRFRLTPNELTGWFVVGDSPGQGDSWKGQLLGLAFYRRQLTASQVLRHYETWTRSSGPEIAQDERNLALYLFDERAGNVVHDKAASGVDLHIPDRYMVVDQILLEPFWHEFSMSWSYWGAALKNIVGFIPLGFCFYAYLSTAGIKRAAGITVLLGFLVSLTIEVLQAFLPMRDSGTSDLFTNTLGTWIGVMSYEAAGSILARVLRPEAQKTTR